MKCNEWKRHENDQEERSNTINRRDRAQPGLIRGCHGRWLSFGSRNSAAHGTPEAHSFSWIEGNAVKGVVNGYVPGSLISIEAHCRYFPLRTTP